MSKLLEQFEHELPKSQQLFREARGIFPDGVTHDLRRLSPFPVYIDRAEGSKKYDVDGHELIDFWAGHGALLMGHSHPCVIEAVQRQITRGTHPGACHALEIEWAKRIQELIPSAERLRFVNSGTEATLMALRLTRMYTGKPRILKLAGHFHGWHDYLMIAVDHLDNQTLPGASSAVTTSTVVVEPDLAKIEEALAGDESIGGVILEPTGGHWGQVPIRGDFLRELRAITTRLKRVLIFDEVITGFRVSPGGAQALYNVTPDLTTLAKIVAGGLPGGCCVGKAEIFAHLETRAGQAKMPHPGTFNANPLSASAGIAVLDQVRTGEPTQRASEVARQIRNRLNRLFREKSYPWVAYGDHAGFRLIPDYDGPAPTEEDFIPYDGEFAKLNRYPPTDLTHAFRCAMLLHGVDLPGLGGLTMSVHSEADIEKTVRAVDAAISRITPES